MKQVIIKLKIEENIEEVIAGIKLVSITWIKSFLHTIYSLSQLLLAFTKALCYWLILLHYWFVGAILLITVWAYVGLTTKTSRCPFLGRLWRRHELSSTTLPRLFVAGPASPRKLYHTAQQYLLENHTTSRESATTPWLDALGLPAAGHGPDACHFDRRYGELTNTPFRLQPYRVHYRTVVIRWDCSGLSKYRPFLFRRGPYPLSHVVMSSFDTAQPTSVTLSPEASNVY